jgi:hypothetical protein
MRACQVTIAAAQQHAAGAAPVPPAADAGVRLVQARIAMRDGVVLRTKTWTEDIPRDLQ